MRYYAFLGLLLVWATGLQASETPAVPARPNIFFLFADDWGRYASVYSDFAPNTTIKTPAIDRIANEGVRFNNAFVNAPSCTPSRSALFSGQYFFRTGRGAVLRPAVWDETIPTYPLLLEKAGYHIGFTYKAWSPGANPDAPYGGDRTRYNKAGARFNRFSQNVTKMLAAGKSLQEAKEEIYDECLKNFESFLANRPEKTPFCYYFGPTNTHRAWEKGSGKALWGLDPESLKGCMPKFLPDVPEIREDLCDYLGEVLALDGVMERFLRKLEVMGELENTVIVLSGDHGIPGFPRGKCNLYDFGVGVPLIVRWGDRIPGGRSVDDLINLMDLAPTFCEIGGVKPPGCMTGKSILPLLLSDKEGRIDPARDFSISGRERHVENAREGLLPYPHRSLRTERHLYIRNFKPDRWPMGSPWHWEMATPDGDALAGSTHYTYADMDHGPTKTWMVRHEKDPQWKQEYEWAFAKRPAEELYDIQNDPDCLENLASRPEHRTVLKSLGERLTGLLKEAGDPRVTGDGLTFEKVPFAGEGTIEIRPPAKKRQPVPADKRNTSFSP